MNPNPKVHPTLSSILNTFNNSTNYSFNEISLFKSASLSFLFLISADKKQDLSKESLIKDIDDYANKIIRNHAHPFNYIKKEQFLDSIKAFKEKAPGMNVDELQVGYTRINALLLDPHTSLDF